ncbi:MAG: hypothetical protein HYS86_04375 [Candidatus Chisholmbacteria bacterium]|nr:hypothetical protein [Candidatus Chisholmbacteria bacterium]
MIAFGDSMRDSTPLASRFIFAWLNLPQVRQAFTVGKTNFAVTCAEVLRHQLATKLIAVYSHSRIKNLPPVNHFNHQAQYLYELMKLFFHHPLVVVRWLGHRFLPPSMATVPAEILVFSNGLHLASYASLIKSLHRAHSVHLVTDRQDPLDAFYLSQYDLYPEALKLTPVAPDDQLLSALTQKLAQLKITLPASFHLPQWITHRHFKSLFQTCLDALIQSFLPRFLPKYAAAQALVTSTRPKLLITTHDPGPSAMAFVLAAKAKHIPTLVLLHGIPSEGMFFFSDSLLVWGPLIRQYLTNQGIPKSKLIPGGQPIFLSYEQYFRRHSPQFELPTIGIIISGYGSNQPHQVKYVRSLINELLKLSPQPKIMLRLHPGQYLDDIAGAKLDLGTTIEEFIAQCSVIISQTSTAILIAALSNRPLIYFPALQPLAPQGILWHHRAFGAVNSASRAAKRVHRLLTQPKYRDQYLSLQKRLAKDYTGPLNKTLGQDLAKAINKRFFYD